MNRQQKRSDLRKLNKDIIKAKSGQLTAAQAIQMQARIQNLQKAGMLPEKRRTKVQRVGDFLKSLGRKPNGFRPRAG